MDTGAMVEYQQRVGYNCRRTARSKHGSEKFVGWLADLRLHWLVKVFLIPSYAL